MYNLRGDETAMKPSKLQQEVKKKQPFASLEQEACLNLLRTNDQMQIRFVRLFREHGLTSSQYNILRILRGEGKPLPILEIADRLLTVVPGITGLIDRLEEAGFAERQRCQADRRVIYVALRNKALKLLTQLDEPVMRLHKAIMGHLSEVELKELIRLLEKTRERCGKDE
jgi:MarR family transcriptional regulator, 2-MHQ and catechol-resistance regulon repressor